MKGLTDAKRKVSNKYEETPKGDQKKSSKRKD